MKNPLLLILLLGLTLSLNAQSPAYNTIHANNIEAGIHANGSMFMDEDGVRLGFFAPFGSAVEIGTIFSAGIWMSATDDNGNLKVTSTQYGGQLNNHKYYSPGPYNASTINFDFNKVWKVTGADIRSHLVDFADGQIDNTVPMSLWDWPGAGNPLYGLPDNQLLAPFFDQNGDGIYDPQTGDYPVLAVDNGGGVNALIPEEMVYTIVNDDSPSFSSPLGVEIHTLLYGFDCDNIEILQNTLFARHTVINRGITSLNNFKFSLWMDADLGCFEDDFMGCDTMRNAFYIYNEDDIDGGVGFSCQAGINTYAAQPPVQSVVLLNQKMENFQHYHNCAVSSPHPATCGPAAINEYANLMNSLWRDGTPLTLGGNGYNPGSQDITRYAYPDHPNDLAGWSMLSNNLPYADRKIIASCGRPELFPSQIMTIDYAYIYTNKDGLDHLQNVTAAFDDIDDIQFRYDDGFSGFCAGTSANKNISSIDEIMLYPNPAREKLELSHAQEFTQYRIVDELGRTIKTGLVENGSSTINLNEMNGIYFLILINESQRITKKIIAL